MKLPLCRFITEIDWSLLNFIFSWHKIVLLWRRAILDPGYKHIFCLAFAEQLSYKVCDESLAELDKLSRGENSMYKYVANYVVLYEFATI